MSTKKRKRDTKRIAVDVVLTMCGVAAFLTTEATGLHMTSAAIFGALVAWHAWTQRALLKAAITRALSQKKPARPVFQALNAALAIAVVATFATGFGLGGGHGFFAYLSLALAGGHVALSWRRILMLASGGRLGKRSRKATPPRVTAPAVS